MRFLATRHVARRATGLASALACALAAAAWAPPASAADMTILHVFGGKKDGDNLGSPLIMDAAGNLYGTSTFGGSRDGGTAFRLSPPADGAGSWAETVLFNFDAVNVIGASATGSEPRSSLWFGDDGTLLGTTSGGAPSGAGNVFQLTPPASGTGAWTRTTVHVFASGDHDAGFPEGTPIPAGASATRFGTTVGGGPANIGALYSLTPPTTPGGDWSEALLYSFTGSEGAKPTNDLVADAKGNLYGVAFIGGANGWGSIFRLSPPKKAGGRWTETTLYSFTGGADGRAPDQRLTLDAQGALWGTTASGGPHLLGNIFRLAPPKKAGQPWVFRNAHVFDAAADGQSPHSGLVPDGAGGFYGTTGTGGAADCGTVYHFQPPARSGQPGVLTTLHAFAGGAGGGFPYGDLLLKDGVLYEQTYGSDSADGLQCNGASVAFKLVP